ncbi:MAG TPA: tetratricopeptide repeat protein [Candidatus Cybelea sp.]|nr:tetratricopeptide repeat protein [Candidatus Cybelea sp.]
MTVWFRVSRFVSAALLAFGAGSAWAQQVGAPQPLGYQPPGVATAPLAPPPQQFAAPPPDLTPKEALTGAAYEPIKTEATLCVRPVMVDGEKKTWDELQTLGAAQTGWNDYMEGDYARAVPVFERLAKVGHPEAERLMGVVYYLGQGVPQDYQRALYWFEKAADQGCFTAFAPTATLYRDGLGTPTDLGKAYMWFNIATSRLPDSVERNALIKERDKVSALMTQAQIEAAQKRSLAYQPKPVIPPDPQDLPVDYFPPKTN